LRGRPEFWKLFDKGWPKDPFMKSPSVKPPN
jgi:hypothetical protein